MAIVTLITMVFVGIVTAVASIENPYHEKIRIDMLGGPVLLPCTERDDLVFHYWVLPDLITIVRENFTARPMDLCLLSNRSLHLPATHRQDLGDYLCLVEDPANQKLFYYKRTVYLYRAPLAEIYRTNLIIAACASGAVLVIFTVGCCIYCNRYEIKTRKRNAKDIELLQTHYRENGTTTQINYDHNVAVISVPGNDVTVHSIPTEYGATKM